MIGRVLNDRYELIEKIGAGGMAIVYLGKDRLLDRRVAIKILQPQFVDNEKAVARFDHEAKAIASLSHPNIVNIFDIGQEDNLHYIVMEYITGQDLKEVLNKEKPLQLSRALEIAQGACRALIKAHRNNIVHCDVKPHNILLTAGDNVKVTDFGIAQAVTNATLNQTNSILGSAPYLSPEQAAGEKVSTKSDIYSLGIVLYELVTGELPFSGQNSVSIALKHMEEDPISPRDKIPTLPLELEKIILQAIAKEPAERYNSVAEMLRDLKEVTASLQAEKETSNQETMVISRSDFNQNQAEETTKKLKSDLEDDTIVTSNQEAKNSNRSLVWGLGIVGLIIVVLLGAGYYFLVDYLTVPEVKVPKVIEQDLETAKQSLSQQNLALEVRQKSYNNQVQEGHVVSQSPKSGEVVKINRVIEVDVSKGAKLVEVPDLREKTLREARLELDKRKLVLKEVKRVYNAEVPEEEIISQTPEPEKEVKSETEVKLVVSKGEQPQEVTVPNLVGLRQEEGTNELRERNLIVGQIIKKQSLNYRQGQIIAQQPTANQELAEGSTVKLIISKGIRNPYDAPVRTSTVKTYISPGKEREVKIVVKDDNGRRIVYQQVHQPEDKVEQKIVTVGSATIKVYIDGRLNIEKKI
ncbi:Stk1 family PASTA domain-containing Ser/Thr kinase [Halanaerobaculum tunisiense]